MALLSAGLAPVLAASVALASAGIRTVPLAEVVRRADVIALVEPDPAGPRTVTIPIPGKGPKGKKAPAFKRRDQRFKVIEVLSRRAGKRTPAAITVAPANWSTRLTVHRRYHLEGVRKIPIYYRMAGGGLGKASPERDGAKPGRSLVLLHRDRRAGFRFVVDGAAVSPHRWSDVLRLVVGGKRTKKTRRGRPTGEPPAEPLAAMGWLAGSWRGKDRRGREVVETWGAPRGATILGTSSTTQGPTTFAFEFLRITRGALAKQGVPPALHYTAQPGGVSPGTTFTAVVTDARDVAFLRRKHDLPQRIRYLAVGKDRLRIEVSGDGRPFVLTLEKVRRGL